ncbi:FMN-binding negative transcriptional regulator [Asticcacaulis taihuensis]|uniref:FMN-binding negative transcriptional regulator n=1 Tax=Asticcacaulis taihuensis TaxID=260084 RepID=UPI003F7CC957
MDPKPAKYAPKSDADILDIVTRYPFAWIVSAAGGFGATQLPVRPCVENGRLTGLIGHFGRNNPQIEHLRDQPRALLLLTGPHGYISPSWLTDRTQAPTWNYASIAFDCDIRLIEDAAGIEALLRDLIDTMEAGRDNAWSLDDMGERATRLARGVVGFHARIIDVQAAFKMGQDEAAQEYSEILTALDRAGETDLATEMRRQNPDR